MTSFRSNDGSRAKALGTFLLDELGSGRRAQRACVDGGGDSTDTDDDRRSVGPALVYLVTFRNGTTQEVEASRYTTNVHGWTDFLAADPHEGAKHVLRLRTEDIARIEKS
jgi:hypothetical protein